MLLANAPQQCKSVCPQINTTPTAPRCWSKGRKCSQRAGFSTAWWRTRRGAGLAHAPPGDAEGTPRQPGSRVTVPGGREELCCPLWGSTARQRSPSLFLSWLQKVKACYSQPHLFIALLRSPWKQAMILRAETGRSGGLQKLLGASGTEQNKCEN